MNAQERELFERIRGDLSEALTGYIGMTNDTATTLKTVKEAVQNSFKSLYDNGFITVPADELVFAVIPGVDDPSFMRIIAGDEKTRAVLVSLIQKEKEND